jgi:hypothetical protein
MEDMGVRTKFLETDLYPPLYTYLTAQGYSVRSEVKHCDIIATKGEDIVAIEMKRGFTLKLVMQAVKRQRITDSVYVAIPRPRTGLRSKSWQEMCHLLKRLELGLIVVSLQGNGCVEVIFHPIPFVSRQNKQARRSILREVAGRSGDFNVGGSSGRKLMTAYREDSIFIACCLEAFGQMSPKELKKLGTTDKSADILRHNYYGWFERIARGTYQLSGKGQGELNEYQEIAEYYRSKIVQK